MPATVDPKLRHALDSIVSLRASGGWVYRWRCTCDANDVEPTPHGALDAHHVHSRLVTP